MVTKAVVLCADDYGMNSGVSRGILELVASGRVSATSCMTNAADWRQVARDLASVRSGIGVGLHVTLTWGSPLGPMPCFAPSGEFPTLGRVLRASLVRRLPLRDISHEIDRQLDLFCDAFGGAPDFVDGHQHVHVLPGIRRVLFDALARRSWAGCVWLRDPSDPVASILSRRLAADKALVVGALAVGFRTQAHRAGFPTNEGFSGFSPFDAGRDAATDMRAYLSALGPHPLVMCHPGLNDPSETATGRDPPHLAAARIAEHAYLASPAFGDLLERRGIVLAPAPA